MFNEKLAKCPKCDGAMELGYSLRNSPLSFVSPEKIKSFIHTDEDLNRAGLKVLLPSEASYNVAYHCRSCRVLVVDFSTPVSSVDAKAAAAEIA